MLSYYRIRLYTGHMCVVLWSDPLETDLKHFVHLSCKKCYINKLLLIYSLAYQDLVL